MLKVIYAKDILLFYMGRAPFGFLLYPVYAFLVGDTLIDTGTTHVAKEFISAIKGNEIKQIVNTHHHEDHIGNNALLQEMFGVPIYAHPLALPYLENPVSINLRPYQKIIWGLPRPSKGLAIGDRVDTGTYKFEIIHTPGHCNDHICLYERKKRWLFTGDLFCGTNFIYLRKDEDYLQILQSLKKLSELEIETIFCSLKGIVTNGKEALLRKISRMENIMETVLRMKDKGISPSEIRDKVLGREDLRWIVTGGHYSKQNTVDNILQNYPRPLLALKGQGK